MNLLLLEADDILAPGRAIIRGRRLTHVQDVHKATVGDTMRVGELGGEMGQATIVPIGQG